MEEFEHIFEDSIEEIIDIPEEPIKVYIETDKDNNIIKVFSSDFEQPKHTSIKIDEGFGDRFRHCQNYYFEKPLINEDDAYNYKLHDGVITENTQ